VNEHISKALAAAASGDEDARWEQVCALQRSGTQEVFAACMDLCSSPVALRRALGADVLGQLRGIDTAASYREQSAPVLTRLLGDAELRVLSAALRAIGHLRIEADPGVLCSLAQHPSADVRYALAVALPSCGGAATIALLIQLMADTDDDVRDWATFGLGTQADEDSEEIRAALLRRVADVHDDTRAEALAGLAVRKDLRVLPALLCALTGETVGALAVEAARDLAAPELLPVLEELTTWWDVDPTLLAEAIESSRAGGVGAG
jgi:HEAT repeat protein